MGKKFILEVEPGGWGPPDLKELFAEFMGVPVANVAVLEGATLRVIDNGVRDPVLVEALELLANYPGVVDADRLVDWQQSVGQFLEGIE